jgi:GGDEF domain-containing protein
VGLACFPQDGNDAEALLSLADNDMYGVKRRRKDTRSAVSSPLVSTTGD